MQLNPNPKERLQRKKGNEMNIPTDAIVMTIALVVGFIFFKMKKN